MPAVVALRFYPDLKAKFDAMAKAIKAGKVATTALTELASLATGMMHFLRQE